MEQQKNGVDKRQMGRLGKQPARQVLLDYTNLEEAACC
jgi:hypothetical protein